MMIVLKNRKPLCVIRSKLYGHWAELWTNSDVLFFRIVSFRYSRLSDCIQIFAIAINSLRKISSPF